jgi:integrase/recombinase XerC
MHDAAVRRVRLVGSEVGVGRGDLAGAARLELVSGVAQLRPHEAMVEAMLFPVKSAC